MKSPLMLALSLGLMSAVSLAQTLPDKPAQGIPSMDPALPGEPDKPLQDPAQKASPTDRQLPTADFSRLDADADGNISRDEAKTNANVNGRFKKLDANADGQISKDEFKASGSAGTSGQKNKSQRKESGLGGTSAGLSI